MATQAYIITIGDKRIFLCGLDQDDEYLPDMLKSEYKKADIMFISSNLVNDVDRIFSDVPHKTSVRKQALEKSQLFSAIIKNRWSSLCLVNISDLEELRKKFIRYAGIIENVDFTRYNEHFDDDNDYYENFPHVQTTTKEDYKSSSYAGIAAQLNPDTSDIGDYNELCEVAERATNHIPPIQASCINLLEPENTSAELIEVINEDAELSIVPYLEPADEENRLTTCPCVIS